MRAFSQLLISPLLLAFCGCSGCSAGGDPPQPLPTPAPTPAPSPTPSPTPTPAPPGPKHGYAIAIGLNAIDPAHYGTNGALSGCEPDANDMASIAAALGYPVTKLLTAQATRQAVLAALDDHAQRLVAGDLLVVSYSGHGGQVPDQNGDEADGLDETWCLFDGQLLDDELHAAWGKFRAGVRILALSDSCHSGTVLKMMKKDIDGRTPERSRELDIQWKNVEKPQRLDRKAFVGSEAMIRAMSARPELRDKLVRNKALRPAAGGGFEAVTPAAVSVEDDEVFVARSLSPDALARTFDKARQFYEQIGRSSPKENATPIRATVLGISGCEDSELSADIGFNGLFTWNLKLVWASGAFQGSHPAFQVAIRQRVLASNPDQSPAFQQVGAPDQVFQDATPFRLVP